METPKLGDVPGAEKITIHLENGFERGMWIAKYVDGDFVTVEETGHNTWHDDTAVDKDIELPSDFKGAIGKARKYENSVDLIGFSGEELQSKPDGTYFISESLAYGNGVTETKEAKTTGDILEAKARGSKIVSISELGDGIHSLPFSWGDQPAECFVVVKNGELKMVAKGTGDVTPQLTEGWEHFYDKGDYDALFTCEMENREKDMTEDAKKAEESVDDYYESFTPNDPRASKRKF